MFSSLYPLFLSTPCTDMKSHYQGAECCPSSTVHKRTDVCHQKGLALRNGGTLQDFMKPINFFHRGLGPIELASTIFMYGLADVDIQAARGRFLVRDAEIVTHNVHSRQAIAKHSEADAHQLVEAGQILVVTPTNGISYLINTSLFDYKRDVFFDDSDAWSSADIYFMCNEKPDGVTSNGYAPQQYNRSYAPGVVLESNVEGQVGTNASLGSIAGSTEYLIVKADTCWCPTCLAGLGHGPSSFAPYSAHALDIASIIDFHKSEISSVVFFGTASFYPILEKYNCPLQASAPQTATCNTSDPTSDYVQYLTDNGYPPFMAQTFLHLQQSSFLLNDTEVCVSEALTLDNMLGEEITTNVREEMRKLNTSGTGAKFFNKFAPSVYVNVTYGSKDMPPSTQSGFAILEAKTMKAVVRHTPAFLIGQWAPMSRLILEHIAFAIGKPDLVPNLIKHERVDFTAPNEKYIHESLIEKALGF